MPFQQFELTNWKEWGNLVKEWSRGTGPRPTSPKDFRDLLTARNVGATFNPADFDKIVYRDHEERVVFINVPPKQMIEAAETDLHTKPYFLPPFYALDMNDPTLKDGSVPGKLAFHSERVGEYVVRFCG